MSEKCNLQYRLYFILIFALFMFGAFYQANMLLSPDVTWLLMMSRKMLAGGQYGIDNFETNPPLILILYAPVIWLQRHFLFNQHYTFIGYIYTIELLSVGLSCLFIEKLLPKTEKPLRWSVSLSLVATLLFLPFYSFGQRDFLWLVFILPYLFLAMLRLEGRSVHFSIAILVGLMAFFGFALKPFFLATLGLIEGYMIFSRRQIFAWFRPEILVIGLMLPGYLVWIAFFQPGFYHIVLPIVFRYYFLTVSQSWYWLVLDVNVLFAMGVAIYYVLFRSYVRFSSLGNVLCLSVIGAVASFVFGKALWYYHVLPAVVLACVLLFYLTTEMIHDFRNSSKKSENIVFPIVVMIVFLMMPLIAVLNALKNDRIFIANAIAVSEFIKSQNGSKTIISFSQVGTVDSSLLANISGGQYISSIPFFWWYGGYMRSEDAHLESQSRLDKDWRFLTTISADELQQNHPHWLVLNLRNTVGNVHAPVWWKKMEFNPALKKEFQHYHYRKGFGSILLYERKSI